MGRPMDMLEVASSVGYPSIVKWISERYCTDRGSSFLIAALQGRIDIMQIVHDNIPFCTRKDAKAFAAAAKRGDIAMMEWLKKKKYRCTTEAFFQAGYHGQKEALDWLYA